MLKIAARSSLTIIAIFCLTSAIAFSSVRISFLSFLGNDYSKTESFLYILALENRGLQSFLPASQERSLGKVVFELLTNINFTDMKTLLISEIPGMQAVSPKILIAGEGTDFTNLPIESPPPQNFINVDDEVSEEPIKQENKQAKDILAYVYHTHNRESYLPLLPGTESPNESFHKDKNVTLLGKRLGEKLEEKGIKTYVDTTDVQGILGKRKMSYYQSYEVSRELVVEALNQNKEVDLIFDIHRDSSRKQVTTAKINNKEYAKVMFIIGTGNPRYEKNLTLAKTLHNLLEKKYPGLSRGAVGKDKTGGNGVYNQDLADHSLIIEIGGVDNTLEELNRSVDALADVISEYYWGDAEK